MSHAACLAAQTIPECQRWHRGILTVEDDVLATSFDPARYTALFETMRSNRTMLDTTLAVFDLMPDRGVARDQMYRHAALFTRLANEHGV